MTAAHAAVISSGRHGHGLAESHARDIARLQLSSEISMPSPSPGMSTPVFCPSPNAEEICKTASRPSERQFDKDGMQELQSALVASRPERIAPAVERFPSTVMEPVQQILRTNASRPTPKRRRS